MQKDYFMKNWENKYTDKVPYQVRPQEKVSIEVLYWYWYCHF